MTGPLRLDIREPGFAAAFDVLVNARREADEDVSRDVADIIARVRLDGDPALAEYTSRFDRHDLQATGWLATSAERKAALDGLDPELRKALDLAADRIWTYHAAQKPADSETIDAAGVRMGARWTPVDAAGLYVPGGRAAYPSSVLMNALPARVAGVDRLVMVTPTPDGVVNPLVLAAAELAAVHEVYRVGGAQAIAALAYGTKTIAPVVKIVGPGNAYVAAAKRQVFGQVGIDMVAGPSEVVVIADKNNDASWIASDLLAQAEHDAAAQSILITDNEAFGREVVASVEAQLTTLPRADIARASWASFGAVIVVERLDQAVLLTDRLAPEHLEIATAEPERLAGQIRNAGAIFIGRYTPEVIGDYVAGPNHVLPTARSARFASGLSVLDFMKCTSILKLDAESLNALSTEAMSLAKAEGLEAHRRSVAIRLNAKV